jgi:catechol 2,3-dioxygenase-like lactoylglutathione lyase family enzyme
LTDIDVYGKLGDSKTSIIIYIWEVPVSGRIQLALNVDDLGESIAFYTKLFGTEPAKVRPGYANFAITEPPLKLVLLENPGQGGSLNHLGVEVAGTDVVEAEQARLAEAGLAAVEERDTTCCYARQDKFWVKGAPGGERWEIYTVLQDSQTFWGEDGSQGWDAAAAELGEARGAAVTAGDAAPAPRCCGSGAADEQAGAAAHT